ncbi:hypothetical protein AYO44_12150 [Planctomycetaceae bacterium SCGC AG-212-F19]|nr:hypothetical protein AYO44_12150 [Planctomycetaceae bacterium SCGC AG-212-F19]
MTEQQWLTCKDPKKMLEAMPPKTSDRKQTLVGAACYRAVWRSVSATDRKTIEEKEQEADRVAIDHGAYDFAVTATHHSAAIAAYGSVEAASEAFQAVEEIVLAGNHDALSPVLAPIDREHAQQCHMLRHIMGNPFKPYPAPATWPSTVVELAQAIYDGQNNRLILADALEESGHQELAQHFREEEWHMKGCWAMDVILGKT